HQQRERGLAKSGRPEEKHMIERLVALLGRVDRDLQRLFDFRLTDELVQARRAERRIGQALVLERLGGGYFRASHSSDRLPSACAPERNWRRAALVSGGVALSR